MSNLFTAVSVEQQEIVTGGDNTAANIAFVGVYGDNNGVILGQAAQLISVRNLDNASVKIKGFRG
jgi:hypothetical protein